MITEVMGHKYYLRVLLALYKKVDLRFGQIENLLDLNPVRIDRALKSLCKGFWINTRTLTAEKGWGQTEYRLGKRGASFLAVFATFTADIYQRKGDLGGPTWRSFKVFTDNTITLMRNQKRGNSPAS